MSDKVGASPVRPGVRGLVLVLFSLSFLFLFAASARAGEVVLIPAGSTWKYLDNGSDQGTAWRDPAFNDGTWSSGPAPLGYGSSAVATIVSFGPDRNNRYITTYFRHAFDVTDAVAFTDLTLRLLRDDGAVVYLNGTEIFRSNMPSGTITSTTLASTGGGFTTFVTAAVSADLLVEGVNVLAVEVHQVSASSSDLGFDLALTGLHGLSLKRGPYLQSGTPNSVVVRWRTNLLSDSQVRYGTDPTNLVATADDPAQTREHEVTLIGLASDTKYYYSVGSTTELLAGGDANHFILTAPPAGTAKPTRIWVIGDSGTANTTSRAVRDAYLAYTGTRHTDVWLMLGDNAYPRGTDAEYQAAVFDMYPMLLRRTALWPTFGNHDGDSANSSTQTGPYYEAFTLPKNGEAGGVPSGTEAYYSFNYGNIHFISLDSSESSRSATSPMMNWLRDDLAANTLPWVMAFWHHPPYSKGSVESDTSKKETEMRTNALPALEAAGVDLVLVGHNHTYARSFLIDGHYGISDTFTESMKKDGGDGRIDRTGAYQKPLPAPYPNAGAVYIIAGTASSVSTKLSVYPAMYTALAVKGSVVLDIDGGRLDALFLDSTGAVRDYFTIIKDSSGPPPAAPTGLGATAASFSRIDLVWADNSTDELGFKVERSTDGINFLQIATVAANTPAYSDAGVSGGTTYFYRIRSYNAGGNSVYSNTASATTPVPPPPPTTLVPKGGTWKYLDNGSDQGAAWRDPAFDDSSWASGPAQLGYGDGDEATVVSYGPDPTKKYVTTYFRHAFGVVDASSFSGLTLRLLRDDGAVVYLNGVEVFRSNMPSGTITYTTLASTATTQENIFRETGVSSSLLVNGMNVLAVDVHQSSRGSSDLSFDLELLGSH